MKQRLLIAILTAAVFALGYFSGAWVERTRPVPAPPAPLMAEFSSKRAPAPGDARVPASARTPLNRAQLAAEIERLRPQIESYRQRIETIDADFDRDLAPLLTPHHWATYSAAQKSRAERVKKNAAELAAAVEPFTDDQIDQLRQRSLYGVLWMVAPSMKQDFLIKDLKIDAAQQAKTKELLRARREKFLAIVDSVPPPSIMLSRLAPAAQRIGTDPKKPE
ncbi:MAG: hypothetical protein H7343_05590 [Undibacterium sp.]|nr:hypothetical protein [Opitutaceae bacterium]